MTGREGFRTTLTDNQLLLNTGIELLAAAVKQVELGAN